MRTMALDVGERRIGIAVSDALRITAQGLEVLHRTSIEKDLAKLQSIITDMQVDKIVVGYPKNMDGSISTRCQSIEELTDILRERFPQCSFHFYDERLTTMQAEKVLIQSDMRRDKRKTVIDKMAAVIILQGFLDRHPN